MPATSPAALRLSIVVPTYGRPDRIVSLLARLARQTLAPDAFEVIVVDDGTPEPIRVDAATLPYRFTLLRQPNAGPGAARNLGTEHARAPLLMYLNDDALPAADLLEKHLDAHAKAGARRIAVLGSFPFTADALREPFTRLLADTDLLFDFQRLRDGALHGWTFFWTCNISLPTDAVREVGGFDPAFREAIVEDVELGYRLAARGLQVLYRADAVCEHEHALTAEQYFRRAMRLGVNLARMARKHSDPRILWLPERAKIGYEYLLGLQLKVEAYHAVAGKYPETARRWSQRFASSPIPPAEKEQAANLARKLSSVPFARGVLLELTGVDPAAAIDDGPSRGKLTSIVVCSYDALAKTRNCLDALRRTRTQAHPTEIVFVDNGSTDGSAEWLAEQPDIKLIRNAANVGAPAARNQALAHASGEYVVFLDNDVVVTPGWLERMLYHADVDPLAACIGACADRASHGQEVAYDGPVDFDSLARFANGHAAMNARRGRLNVLLASFCLLVRRSVIDAIGGFDPAFSPWGFEDDDYTLRAWLAGWHNRIALDVFVRHDSYVGPKLERHVTLLERNWRIFARKWGLGDAPYGKLAGIESLRQQNIGRDRTYVDPTASVASALPAASSDFHTVLRA